MKERKAPRINLEIGIRLASSASETIFSVWLLDLSQVGLKLKANFPSSFNGLRTGDDIDFETAENFYSIKGRGRVSWVSEDLKVMGVEFTALDNKSKQSLEEFLNVVFSS